MNRVNFYGRIDGLGNRFGQIIYLEAICARYKIAFNYFWNNNHPESRRRYDVLIRSDKVKIIKSHTHNLRVYPSSANAKRIAQALPHIPAENYRRPSFSQEEFLAAAKKIEPLFDIGFENDVRPIGVHIRGTDRILGSPSRTQTGFMTKAEFNGLFRKTILAVNRQGHKHVFVCADNEQYKQRLIDALDAKIIICDPGCNSDIPEYYRDFFALTLCRKIYLVSKFSSFSACAALVGGAPIVVTERTKIELWHVPFELLS